MSQTFFKDDSLNEKTRYRELVRRIWPYLKKYKGLLFCLVAVVTVHTTLGRILPQIIGWAVDHILIPKNLSALKTVVLIYLGLEILRFIMMIVETYFFQVLGLKIIFDLRHDVFSHVQKLPVSFFDRTPVGRLVTRVTNDFSSIADLFTAGLVSVFTDSVSLIAIVIAMSLLNFKLTLIAMGVMPLTLWMSIRLSQKARIALRIIKRRLAAINAFLSENISGMKIIQLYTREEKHLAHFGKLNAEYRDIQIQNIRYLAWLYPLLNAFNAFTVTAALYYGGILKSDNLIGVGVLVAFLTHVQDFLPPLRNILEKYQTFQTSLASAERIFALLDEKIENLKGHEVLPPKITGHIEFKNVVFSYNSSDEKALDGVSFDISPGQSVALVGATGSGKSTIISLLQRFHELNESKNRSGKILIDGKDISKVPIHKLRSHIGVVQQDFFLFSGSISSNISLSDPRITQEKIRGAALKANCEEVMASHQGGLNAQVQEKGSNLSSGEKQLINFARILAFEPDILILDEATAHIDSQSEALIQQATKEITRNRTSVIIAHRLSTIEDCDKILVLDKGKLVEQGSHQELLEIKGHYHKLYTIQQGH